MSGLERPGREVAAVAIALGAAALTVAVGWALDDATGERASLGRPTASTGQASTTTTELVASLGAAPVVSPPQTTPSTAAPVEDATGTTVPTSSVPTGSSAPARSTTPATAPPTSASPVIDTASTAPTSAPPPVDFAQLVAIQTVPAVRDVLLRVDGATVATGVGGLLELTPEQFDDRVEFVGAAAEPALREIDFVGWSDGSDATVRDVADMPGPIIQLGVRTRTRVFVELTDGAPDATSVIVETSLGDELELPVGEATRVVESTVESVDGALVAVDVRYTVTAVVRDGVRAAVEPQAVRPTPEALWVVEP